jgi:putative membrane protein
LAVVTEVTSAAADSPDSGSADSNWTVPAVLLGVFVAFWLALAFNPVSREDWLLENLLVFASVPTLVLTRNRLRFSNAAYACLFAFLVLHAVGAHYTYSEVPYDPWWQAMSGSTLNELMGWNRNHYDRLVHFMYGALLLLPAVELLDRYSPPRGLWRWIFPVTFLMAHAVAYELFEWLATLLVAPELGAAYLGTQGDVWDAQKDMGLATLGSILVMFIVALRRARQHRAQ